VVTGEVLANTRPAPLESYVIGRPNVSIPANGTYTIYSGTKGNYTYFVFEGLIQANIEIHIQESNDGTNYEDWVAIASSSSDRTGRWTYQLLLPYVNLIAKNTNTSAAKTLRGWAFLARM